MRKFFSGIYTFLNNITDSSFTNSGLDKLGQDLYGKSLEIDGNKYTIICQYLPNYFRIIITINKKLVNRNKESSGCIYFGVKTNKDVKLILKSILIAFPRPFKNKS